MLLLKKFRKSLHCFGQFSKVKASIIWYGWGVGTLHRHSNPLTFCPVFLTLVLKTKVKQVCLWYGIVNMAKPAKVAKVA